MKTNRAVRLPNQSRQPLFSTRPRSPAVLAISRRIPTVALLVALLAGSGLIQPHAQTSVYWDTNGSSTGATNTTAATGTWDQSSSSNWSTNSSGTSSTNTWANRVTSSLGGRARFSAGTNATGAYTVTVSGNVGNNSGTDNLYAINFDNGAVTLGGSGTLYLQTGGITIASTNANTQTISAKVVLAANQTWDTSSSNLNVSGVISGTGSLTKAGSGTLTLSGTNTYTGDTLVSAGTLFLSSSNVIADASDLSISSGAQVTLNGSSSETVGSLSGAGTLFLQSGTFTTNTTANTTFSGSITDYYGSFRKAGTGDLTLSGASTFGGLTYVDGGTLIVANNTALGGVTYGNAIASGATLALQGGVTVNEGSFSVAGTGDGGIGAIENRSGTNSLSAQLNVGGATTITATSGNLTLSGQIATGTSTVTFNGAGNTTASNQISGSGGVIKDGSGTLTFSGSAANSHSGATLVKDGTLVLNKTAGTNAIGSNTALTIGDGSGAAGSAIVQLGAANQIADSTPTVTIAADGRLDLNNNAETFDTLTGTGQVSLGSGTLSLGVNSGSSTYNGVISGTGNLTKVGSGVLTLGGTNTHSSTTVNGGNLVLTSGGSAGTIRGDLTINAGATVTATATDAFGYTTGTKVNNVTVDGGTLINDIPSTNGNLGWGVAYTLSNGALLSSNGGVSSTTANSNFTFGNGTTVNATAGTSTIAGRVNLRGDSSITNVDFTVASGANLNVTAGISNSSGTVGLTKLGPGTMTLSGANTYGGNTVVAAGTLVAASNSALGSGGTTSVNSGGTLALTGGVTIDTETAINLAGNGSGSGALLNLAGTNTVLSNINLTAATTIGSTGGTLQLGDPSIAAWPVQGTVAMGANDLTFNTAGGDIFLRLTLTGSGNVIKTGGNTLTVKNGFNDGSSGNFLINDGTLILDTFNNENLGIMGNVTVGDGIGAAGSARFQQGTTESGVGLANNLIKDTSNITINRDGYWDLQGYKELVNNVTMNGGTIEAKNNSGTGDRLDIIGTLTANTANTSTIDGRLGLNNDTAKSIVVNAGSTLDINAIVSNGGFNKSGTGTLVLSGANSFTGNAVVSAGILRVDNNLGLGATAGYTQVNNNAQLQLDQVSIGAEQLYLNGSGISSSGALRTVAGTTNVWGGAVTLQSNAEIETASGSSLTINGSVTGSGKTLTVESIGNTTLNGNNTFNTLNKTGAGTLTVTGVNTYATANINAGTFTIGNSNILSDLMDINLGAAGTFNVANHTEVIDDLAGSGTLMIGSTGALTIDNLGNGSAFTGTLDVDGVLTLNGGIIGGGTGADSSGTMVLTAGNSLQIATSYTFGGTLQLNAGTNLNLTGAGTTFNVDTLHITGNTVIDFAGINIATLNIGHLIIDPGASVSATGWSSFYDLWTALTFTGATLDNRNSTTAQITFSGFNPSDTIWLTYDYGSHEITVPEPSTYGALLMSAALGAYALRRRKRRNPRSDRVAGASI